MKTKSIKFIYALVAVFAAVALLFFAAFASGCSDEDDDDFASQAGNGLLTGDEIGDETEENNGDSTGDNNSSEDENNDGSESDDTQQEEDLSQALVIPKSNITTSARFFGIYVDGTYMEVIAFKSGSSYRTAFNTCQVCYATSRNAYYVQQGSYLVCQECGSRFSLANVGVTRTLNTCSPYTILSSERNDTDDAVIISYSYLVSARNLFRTWKV